MNDSFKLSPGATHLWRVRLSDFAAETSFYEKCLSADERERAARYRFIHHKERFIIARAMLRTILSLYIKELPENISFRYAEQGKPFLKKHSIQFNVSHSEDIAVYAISLSEIGVDVEKKEEKDHDALVKRFFSEEEQAMYLSLSPQERIAAFYELWSGKEAVVKAVGDGLFAALRDFTVQLKVRQTVKVKEQDIYLERLFIAPDYLSTLASLQPIDSIFYWQWTLRGPLPLTDINN